MIRITGYTLMIVTLIACFIQGKKTTEGSASANSPANVDGVYEFVSEITVLRKPRDITYKRTSPEWVGIWQLQNGYYSRVLMKGSRNDFVDPKKFESLGFESFAGPYELKTGSIMLIKKYALNPFEIDRSSLMRYQIDSDTLTLTEKLYPYLEDSREGTITTVLRRLK